VLVALLVSFFVWRRQRWDFLQQDIFELTGLLWLAVGIGTLGGVYVSVAMGVVTTFWWCKRKKWNFWEWSDELGPLSLLVISVGQLNPIVAVGVPMALWVRENFKKIRWYKSGRLGLAGLTALGWWGMAEFLVAIWRRHGLYWKDTIPLVLAIVALTIIFIRHGKKT